MLPIVLVLFVAASAIAAPSVQVSQVAIQQTARPYDSGAGFNGGLTAPLLELVDGSDINIYIPTLGQTLQDLANQGLAAQLLELVDGGDTNIYILTLEQILQDLANQKNSQSQALAVAQILAILGEIGYGRPGSSCAAANAINQYASGRGGQSYLSALVQGIDTIAALAANPASLRQAQSSSGGNCGNYQFEAAWSGILNSASPYNLGLVNEEYCAAKRLYQAFSVRSNNVAAAATAASLPPVVAAVQRNLVPLVNFLRAAANGNGYGLAAEAKQALLRKL